MLENNRAFYLQVALFIITLSNDRSKHHMENIHGEYEYNDFAMNSVKKMINTFERYCDNENTGQVDITSDINISSKNIDGNDLYT